jgi:hypothetical protein
MQDCYNRYGEPTAEVFLRCHRDHVDLYESIIIRMNLGEKCLNGAIPFEVPQHEISVLMNNPQFILHSTAQHFETMLNQQERIKELYETAQEWEDIVDDLFENGIKTPEQIQDELDLLKAEVEELEKEKGLLEGRLEGLKNLPWYRRLFKRYYTV